MPLIPILQHALNAYSLRQTYRGEVLEFALPRVVERVNELRIIRGGSTPVQPPSTPLEAPNAPPDSTP